MTKKEDLEYDFNSKVEDWKAFIGRRERENQGNEEGAKKHRADDCKYEGFQEDMIDAPVIDTSRTEILAATEDGLFGIAPAMPTPFWLPREQQDSGIADAQKMTEKRLDAELGANFAHNKLDDGEPSLFGDIKQHRLNDSNSAKENAKAADTSQSADDLNRRTREKSSLSSMLMVENKQDGLMTEAALPGSKFGAEANAFDSREKSSLAGASHAISTAASQQKWTGKLAEGPSTKYMNGTIPFDTTQEVIGHLEARIRIQDIQIENYRETIKKLGETIRMQEQEQRLCKSGGEKPRHALVEHCVCRGLEIIEELKKEPEAAEDQRGELDRQKNENIRLKSIINELVDKIKVLKNL